MGHRRKFCGGERQGTVESPFPIIVSLRHHEPRNPRHRRFTAPSTLRCPGFRADVGPHTLLLGLVAIHQCGAAFRILDVADGKDVVVADRRLLYRSAWFRRERAGDGVADLGHNDRRIIDRCIIDRCIIEPNRRDSRRRWRSCQSDRQRPAQQGKGSRRSSCNAGRLHVAENDGLLIGQGRRAQSLRTAVSLRSMKKRRVSTPFVRRCSSPRHIGRERSSRAGRCCSITNRMETIHVIDTRRSRHGGRRSG